MTTMTTNGRPVTRALALLGQEELTDGIDRIRESAEELPGLPGDQRSATVARVLRWVDEVLKPHMAWEEDWLLPRIEGRERTPWATQFIRFDHRQIAQQAARLQLHTLADGGATSDDARTLVADLTGLAALLRAKSRTGGAVPAAAARTRRRPMDTGVAGLSPARSEPDDERHDPSLRATEVAGRVDRLGFLAHPDSPRQARACVPAGGSAAHADASALRP